MKFHEKFHILSSQSPRQNLTRKKKKLKINDKIKIVKRSFTITVYRQYHYTISGLSHECQSRGGGGRGGMESPLCSFPSGLILVDISIF